MKKKSKFIRRRFFKNGSDPGRWSTETLMSNKILNRPDYKPIM